MATKSSTDVKKGVSLELRYPVTPREPHVAEGAREWPLSPWRLCRLLLAAGFHQCGWRQVPPEGRSLLAKLAAAPPSYLLPPTQGLEPLSHIWHGVVACLGVRFPTQLSPKEKALLEELVVALAYLQRADSWVEVRCVPEPPSGLEPCELSEHSPGLGYARMPLLAPVPVEAYASWRRQALERELARRLERERAEAEREGKAPASALSKPQQALVRALFPEDLLEALRMDTHWLRQAGWSQPPGSRWLSYWRPRGALDQPIMPTPRRERARERPVDTALLALTAPPKRRGGLPRLTEALPRMGTLHEALVRHSDEGQGPAPCFTARQESGEPLRGHQHASLLPLDLDEDRLIDHVLVYAPMGLEGRALRALERVRELYASGMAPVLVSLREVGRREDFEETLPHTLVARRWVSVTPYLAPRHYKRQGRDSLEGQVRAELAERGFPEQVTVQFEVGRERYSPAEGLAWALSQEHGSEEAEAGSRVDLLTRRWRHFRRERLKEARKAPAQPALGLRLTFAEPVRGPVCLGYGSHFGLGQFIPE